LARGVISRARELGYSVMFFDTNKDNQVEKEALSLMQSKQVDGVILSFNESNRDELEKLKQENFPVVQIYRKGPHSTISTVALDNVEAGKKATKYLIEKKHNRIGFITTGKNTQSGYERLIGYRKALEEEGIPFDESLIQSGENNAVSGDICMRNLLNLENPPTAVFVSHDMMAAGAYDAVFTRGLSIPQDISVIGHDNISLSQFLRPKLTTLDTHKDLLGRAGVDLLMEEIEAEKTLSREVVFQSEIVERDSVRIL
jgi:LacI family transcriptional regulator